MYGYVLKVDPPRHRVDQLLHRSPPSDFTPPILQIRPLKHLSNPDEPDPRTLYDDTSDVWILLVYVLAGESTVEVSFEEVDAFDG